MKPAIVAVDSSNATTVWSRSPRAATAAAAGLTRSTSRTTVPESVSSMGMSSIARREAANVSASSSGTVPSQ
ncbi:hypothetical protein ACGF8B_32425 [Streptomyces sp. NPDC047917]|uniref:hypothetical protein n=1 Tax=Streptomyces sp. NPDC047917 TaxID=3365491 RepID=UPI0037247F22